MGEKKDRAKDEKHADEMIQKIIKNYEQNEKSIVSQLYFQAGHGPTIGGYREEIWRSMFEQIIPKKFVIEQSVFIIDSYRQASNEVDLAIFDEMYTPYIFHYGKLKFLPIEAVAVVVECKSRYAKKDGLKNWVESIRKLRTSNDSIARMAHGVVAGAENSLKTQTATRPIRILCTLEETFEENFENKIPETDEEFFDIIVKAVEKDDKKGKKERLGILLGEMKYLQDWYLSLNHAQKDQKDMIGSKKNDIDIATGENIAGMPVSDCQVGTKDEPVSLLSLNLQLNQLLMLINNPMLFPHRAYAKMFNEVIEAGLSKGSLPDKEPVKGESE